MKKLIVTGAALLIGAVAYAQELPKGNLSKEQVKGVEAALAKERDAKLRHELKAEWEARELKNGDYRMKFWDTIYGPAPADGRSMYISMHGGGGTTARMNDGQWNNQKRLYKPAEGLYWVPRAPTDTWNLWHQEYMDEFLRKAIAAAVLFEGVNPNKVYITGYSAGGDGTFQMAPRMADHWAAAAMMAGHPGDAAGESLRNLPFAIYMGGQDAAYNRNGLARAWKVKLDSLAQGDPGGYIHDVKIYEECGHWMNSQDSVAIPWMAKYTRNPYPKKVVWVQDDVLRDNFYWLGVPAIHRKEGSRTVVKVEGQAIDIQQMDAPVLLLGLNDQLVDLDKPVVINWDGKQIGKIKVKRKAETMKNHPLDKSAYSLDAPYPAVLKIERNGAVKNGATVVEL